MLKYKFAPLVLLSTLVFAGDPLDSAYWKSVVSGSKASFRGLSVVSEKVIWVGGTGATVLLSTDGGSGWIARRVPDAIKMDFRDVWGFDKDNALIMSAGPGGESRIYLTANGGLDWSLVFTNSHEKGFFDGMAFWDRQNGMAYSDPVDGAFLLMRTADGGKSWQRVPPEDLPKSLTSEASFAASGSGIVVAGSQKIWFSTGGAEVARLFQSKDRGENWSVVDTPLIAGKPSAGIFSIAFADEHNGVLVGGDYREPKQAERTGAYTRDGGQTWTLCQQGPTGYRSGVAFVPGTNGMGLVAVGSGGTDVSSDGGQTWRNLDSEDYNAIRFVPGKKIGWAVGPNGRIARLIID